MAHPIATSSIIVLTCLAAIHFEIIHGQTIESIIIGEPGPAGPPEIHDGPCPYGARAIIPCGKGEYCKISTKKGYNGFSKICLQCVKCPLIPCNRLCILQDRKNGWCQECVCPTKPTASPTRRTNSY